MRRGGKEGKEGECKEEEEARKTRGNTFCAAVMLYTKHWGLVTFFSSPTNLAHAAQTKKEREKEKKREREKERPRVRVHVCIR